MTLINKQLLGTACEDNTKNEVLQNHHHTLVDWNTIKRMWEKDHILFTESFPSKSDDYWCNYHKKWIDACIKYLTREKIDKNNNLSREWTIHFLEWHSKHYWAHLEKLGSGYSSLTISQQ